VTFTDKLKLYHAWLRIRHAWLNFQQWLNGEPLTPWRGSTPRPQKGDR
jgi:hypothetical protein